MPRPLRLGPQPSWGAASGRALPASVGASGTMPSVGTFRDLKRTLQVKELRVEIVRRIGLNRTSGMCVLENAQRMHNLDFRFGRSRSFFGQAWLNLASRGGRHNNAIIEAYSGIIIRNSGALESPLNFPKVRARVAGLFWGRPSSRSWAWARSGVPK